MPLRRIVLTKPEERLHTAVAKADPKSGAERLPAKFFASSGPAISIINSNGEGKEEQ
jgi:hypothetical protein